MNFDIAIVGAGPSGLCFAQALAESGLRIVILERQPEAALANPGFDGREIALTHHSARLMRELGLWERIVPDAISPLRDARVLNGLSLYAMNIDHSDSKQGELGYLISNCLIRKAAYDAVKSSPAITLMTEARIDAVRTDDEGAHITLANGETISAQLLVAADSRFSETRRAMGISATMHDFGKVMMVCVMEHEVPHRHVAWEWFDYGQTLALLPMNGMRSSVVVTMPARQIGDLMEMDEDDFSRAMEKRFQHRLGAMQLASTRHGYPLVTVYPDRFTAKRFALIGDAAVGMHPVTAHGFNFGLRGADVLASEIMAAHARGGDIAAAGLLARYERRHRFATRPLFLATHAIAKLYSDDSPPARLLRAASLRIGNRIAPFKRAVAQMLTEAN
ncbi:2-octaprenyl-6-methoxyphenol hydroxylase [Methylophilaceae bacterium]|nr:2-octaprenyl-6-methoxyphenol hydroxylase [Methylophilaceae bacterium]